MLLLRAIPVSSPAPGAGQAQCARAGEHHTEEVSTQVEPGCASPETARGQGASQLLISGVAAAHTSLQPWQGTAPGLPTSSMSNHMGSRCQEHPGAAQGRCTTWGRCSPWGTGLCIFAWVAAHGLLSLPAPHLCGASVPVGLHCAAFPGSLCKRQPGSTRGAEGTLRALLPDCCYPARHELGASLNPTGSRIA